MKKKIIITSPVPQSLEESSKQVELTFPDAIREILIGKKITKLSWNDTQEFGVLRDGYLMIHTKGAYHQWIVNDGDLNGSDWVVILEN